MKKNKLYIAILWGLAGGITGEALSATDLFNNPVVIGVSNKPVDTFNSSVATAPTLAITAPIVENKPVIATPIPAPETVTATPASTVATLPSGHVPVTPADIAASTEAQSPQGTKSKLWSYQPVKQPTPPDVKNKSWVRTPLDSFVLAPLEAKGLTPSADADRAAFIRRATLDVWGVIPTPEEVNAFVSDTSPDAYEKLADRLLASTKYGERQARRWLDLARYADSTGFQNDGTRPNFWRYRDYVINAFNSDKPYSQFIQEQIAGDEILPDKPEGIIATGFLAGFPDNSNSRDLVQRK